MLNLERWLNDNYRLTRDGIAYECIEGIWKIVSDEIVWKTCGVGDQVLLTFQMAEEIYKQKLRDGSVFPDFFEEFLLQKERLKTNVTP